jgi:hypothetical protein
MINVMTVETKYLVTDGYDFFHFAETKEEAAELATDEALAGGGEIGIFEIKQVGCAYTPEPSVKVEWE